MSLTKEQIERFGVAAKKIFINTDMVTELCNMALESLTHRSETGASKGETPRTDAMWADPSAEADHIWELARTLERELAEEKAIAANLAEFVKATEQRAEAAERDAERYRWLRQDQATEFGEPWAVTRYGKGDETEPVALHYEALDAAIDAARAQEGKS